MNWRRRLIEMSVPRIGWALVWILYATNRKAFFIDKSVYDDNTILAFWHGEILMLPMLYRKLRQHPNIYILSSNHFDGGLIAKMCECFGFESVRGSTGSGHKGGVRALMQLISGLRNGKDVGIAVDGPKGPYHHIADGVIMMAQKTGKRISVCRVVPSLRYEFGTWDRFSLPLPFGKICYYMGASFALDPSLSLEEAREVVKKQMQCIQGQDKGES